MIYLSIDQAAALYVLLFVIIFVGGYAFSLFRKYRVWNLKEYKLWHCTICAFVYSSIFDQDMTVCPRCGSYNKKELEEENN